jgi:predicted ATPase
MPPRVNAPDKNTWIQQIGIKNFKAFANMQSLPIRPITLIFGANSSGKSSILHSLLFLSQIQTDPGKIHANITYTDLGGNLVDLGGFPSVAYKHQSNNTLQFTIAATIKNRSEPFNFSMDVCFNKNGNVDSVSYSVNKYNLVSFINLSKRNDTGYSDSMAELTTPTKVVFHNIQQLCEDSNSFVLDYISNEFQRFSRNRTRNEFAHDVGNLSKITSTSIIYMRELFSNNKISEDIQTSFLTDRVLSNAAIPMLRVKQRTGNFRFFMNEDELARNIRRVIKQSNDAFILDEPKTEHLYATLTILTEFCLDTSETIINQIQKALYLGPLRRIPSRNFNEMFEPHQERATGLMAWKKLSQDKSSTEKVNEWMKKLGVKYRLTSEQIYERSQLDQLLKKRKSTSGITSTDIDDLPARDSYLRFEDLTSKTNVSHRDLGIGVSQVLPIIVNAVSLTDSLILIEQPELHLHPKLQAELAELFIETAGQKGTQKNTYILETHSEHIILRILRRIREGKLSPNDVSILYVSPDRTGSIVHYIAVDKDGDFLDHWPDGFFEESYRERMAGR